MDWYSSLQAFIDMYFTYLPTLTMLGFAAILMLLLRKMAPKTRRGR
jgi:hypothetical protein